METQVAEMFGIQTEAIEKKIESMAIFIAETDDEVSQLQQQLSEKKQQLDQAKADLSMLMRQNGIEKLSLTNGLTPKATINRKYFKQSGVSDEQLFDWLKANDLGDIIKPSVHFQTLQGTLKSFTGEIPDAIFNVSDVPTITMYGKSKFLASRGGA